MLLGIKLTSLDWVASTSAHGAQSAKSLIKYSMKTQGIEHFNPSSFIKACNIPVGNWTNGHSDHLMYYTDGISLLSDVVLQFPSLLFFNVIGIL